MSLISGTVASLPVQLFRETAGKTEAIEDDRVTLINDDTGNLMNGVQLKSALVRDYLLYGGGYAYIKKSGNTVKSLHYVKPQCVDVQKNSDPIFKDAVFSVNGTRYEEYDFIKLCRNSDDGVTGKGLVTELAQLLTAQYNLIRFSKVLAKSGGNKKGFLQAEKALSDTALESLKESWRRLYESQTPDVLILNNGLKYTDAAQTSVEMQLDELMSRGAAEICRACGVPSLLLEGAGTDDMWQMFYKTAVNPALKAFEATLNHDLLLYSERNNMYFAFDTKELCKGDMLKRYQAYEVAARNGFMQIDEIRYAEDLEPLGLGFIKLGLQDVLYDPETKQIYTPNTDKTSVMGKSEDALGLLPKPNKTQNMTSAVSVNLKDVPEDDTMNLRYNKNHDPETGRFTSGAGGGKGRAVNSKERKAVQSRRKPIRVSKQEYAVISDSISQNYDARYEQYAGKGTCHVQTANYNYRVEIKDRHSFIILGRRKLQ